MIKKRYLDRRKNTFEKRISTWFLSGHPSSGLTQQVDRFTSSQLQTRILNEIDSSKVPG
jgi:hypothetical protein